MEKLTRTGLARLEYHKKYNLEHREELRQRSRDYYQEHREEQRRKGKERYWARVEENRKNRRRYEELHKERLLKESREKVGIKNATGERKKGTCLICLREGVVLVCDHNHETGEIRGWVCKRCNMISGALGDSVEVVTRLKEYLEKGSDHGLPKR